MNKLRNIGNHLFLDEDNSYFMTESMTKRSGYSGKPLYQKLGIKEDTHCLLVNPPDQYIDWLECPFELQIGQSPLNFIHIFEKEQETLHQEIREYLPMLVQNGMIWVSWPKKSSKVPTTITEDVIREVIFQYGLVDVKVCSVSPIWSALKVVIRKENRTK